MYLDYDVLRTTCMSVLNVEKRCNGFSIEDFNRVNEFSLNLIYIYIARLGYVNVVDWKIQNPKSHIDRG